MKVNLNDYAFVRLTPVGEQRWRLHYAELEGYGIDLDGHKASLIEPTGEWRFQLHELMLIFGPLCYNGSTSLPFEQNSVRIESSL